MADFSTEPRRHARWRGHRRVLATLLLASAVGALPATHAAEAVTNATSLRIDFGQLTEQPGKVLLLQAVITEEDQRGNALKTIRADRAESNGLDATNNIWTFSGMVTVTIPEGELRAEHATVLILRGRIGTADVSGTPASFEQRAPEGDAVRARGRADNITYDSAKGELVFTGNVWFTSDSTGEISSSRATYNIPQRTSSFEKGENGRVKGTIRLKPRSGAEADKGP